MRRALVSTDKGLVDVLIGNRLAVIGSGCPAQWKAQGVSVVQMRWTVVWMVAAAALVGSACNDGEKPAAPALVTETVQTSIDGGACRKEVDRSDPNETPILVCPGAAGYTLVVRRVDAGRQSVDVVDPTQRRFPLDLHEFVTRHMASLEGPAQWRVATLDGRPRPIALVLHIQAHEDVDDPARVTRALLAQARIDADGACITNVRPADGLTQADWQAWADSASKRACATALPPLIIEGQRVR